MTSACKPFWRCSLSSVTGPSHATDGTDCQDFCAIAALEGRDDLVLVALSDGAGSAAFAREGAEIVVNTWLSHFAACLANSEDPVAVIKQLGHANVCAVLETIRQRVGERAVEAGVSPSEFSATLLGAVLSPQECFFAQVGDGCWVGEIGGVLGAITWPVNGEFASQTHFAISQTAPTVLQCVHVPAGLTAVAGFSDGVERLALHLGTRVPEPNFFGPLFALIREHGSAAAETVREFLESDRVKAESDDDKTLVIFARNDLDLR